VDKKLKSVLVAIMNWLARPFPSINAIVLSIFASLLFLAGAAIAWHPYITEFLDIAQASKLRAAVRILAFIVFSCYCTLGCLCRILIQFFPERFGQDQGHI
jgi:hypothetical protein